jgi:hypothetical protein
MSHPLSLSLLVVVGSLSLACGGGALDADPKAAAAVALRAEVRPRVLVDEQLQTCFAATVTAAETSGANNLVTHGTLDVRGGNATYDASPDDVLVLLSDDGETRYHVAKLVTDPEAATLAEVFVRDHEIHCTATRDGEFDLDLVSKVESDASTRSVFGTLTDDDAGDLEVDVSETGSSSTSFEAAFTRFDSTHRREGTVTGEGVDVSFTDDDTNLILVGNDVLENRTTESSVDATIGGSRYTLDKGLIRRSFKNTVPAEPEFWGETSGTLEKDGEAFGEVKFVEGPAGQFQIVLETDEGTELIEEHTP